MRPYPVCSKYSRGLGRSDVFNSTRDLLKLIEWALEASSMYFIMQELLLEDMNGSGLGSGQGIEGLKSDPLNFIMKRKHPRDTL